jgi:ketosteroid isomerase-like protein
LPGEPDPANVSTVEDVRELTDCNEQFIEACRAGSWEQLRTVLGDDFRYTDGRTGELWQRERYVADLRDYPAPTLVIDELVIHVAGNTATVSARSRAEGRTHHDRYLDTYERRDRRWLCVHACVWPLPPEREGTVQE